MDETFVPPQFLLVEKIVARRKLQLPQLQFFMVVHIPVVAQRPFLLVLLFSRPRDSAVPRGYGVRRPCFTGGESSTGAVVEKTVAPTVAPVLKLAAWSSSSRYFLGPCTQVQGQKGHVHRDMAPRIRCRHWRAWIDTFVKYHVRTTTTTTRRLARVLTLCFSSA